MMADICKNCEYVLDSIANDVICDMCDNGSEFKLNKRELDKFKFSDFVVPYFINDKVIAYDTTKILNQKNTNNNPLGFDKAPTLKETLNKICNVLEWKYSSKELQSMGRYDKVSSDELIWVKEETHRHNKVIHKGEIEAPNRISESLKGTDNHWTGRKHSEATKKKISESKKGKIPGNKGKPTTLFGKLFIEHFGILPADDFKLYNRELMWFKRHNKCKWE